ncbi:MAG TPA: ABC transporter permease [Polyangiaceae bacterium]|nr:ABC transporter permease [Polyangiaceae bacterium]
MEFFDELWSTLRQNKLRTLLTGMSVAWGTFMLVLLLGAGRGLENGVAWEFRDDAVNSIWVFTGRTSIPFAGRGPGRQLRFNNDDLSALKSNIKGIEYLTGRFWLWGEFSVRYRDRHAAFDILGAHPDQKFLEKTLMTSGRFLNDRDIAERRKVAVIGDLVRSSLFREEDPLGKYVEIRGVAYRVVGVFQDVGGEAELRKVYVPITTAQLVYSQPNLVHAMAFTIGDADVAESQAMEQDARRLLSERLDVAPNDLLALRTQNNLEKFAKLTAVFGWINGFVWFVGVGTMLAGMISVSNIMLISVAERTREIGIRKAIGATPGSLVRMVLFEAILITGVSGYSGLLAGVGLVELIAPQTANTPFLRNPEVDVRMALIATALIVLAGALAGFVPARRAARVNPIVALRD